MLTIKCAKCRKKLLKYYKIGEGHLIHCWKKHIKENHTIQKENSIQCTCGNTIGRDQKHAIKIHHASVIITGKPN